MPLSGTHSYIIAFNYIWTSLKWMKGHFHEPRAHLQVFAAVIIFIYALNLQQTVLLTGTSHCKRLDSSGSVIGFLVRSSVWGFLTWRCWCCFFPQDRLQAMPVLQPIKAGSGAPPPSPHQTAEVPRRPSSADWMGSEGWEPVVCPCSLSQI